MLPFTVLGFSLEGGRREEGVTGLVTTKTVEPTLARVSPSIGIRPRQNGEGSAFKAGPFVWWL